MRARHAARIRLGIAIARHRIATAKSGPLPREVHEDDLVREAYMHTVAKALEKEVSLWARVRPPL